MPHAMLTRLLALHAGRQQVGLPQADIIETGTQALHRQRLVPLLSLQLCKAHSMAKRGLMAWHRPARSVTPYPNRR